MKIVGTDGMTPEQVGWEVQRGGKFVFFQYCISLLVVTFKRPSSIYLIKSGESSLKQRLSFTLISLVFGWWGFPWGPIWTLSTIAQNLAGGKDVTKEILASISQGTAAAGAPSC
jgi:hypothetical protein